MKDDFFEALLQFAVGFSQLTDHLLSQARPDSLTPLQFKMLQIIAEDGAITLSDLCGCSQISLPNGSRELKKLFELKLVEKIEAPTDKRKQLIKLSASGQSLMGEAYGTLQALVSQRYKDHTEEDFQRMTDNLKFLHQKLK